MACVLAFFAATFGPTDRAGAQTGSARAPLSAGNSAVSLQDLPPGNQAGDVGPSSVIFPAQKLALRFSHKRHVKGLGLSCTYCHDRAVKSRQSSDSLIPTPTRCDGCHGSDHQNLTRVGGGSDRINQCAYCHLRYRPEDGNRVEQSDFSKPNLRFNHAIHLERNIGCAQCHGAVERMELATRDQLPRMRGCFGCHQMPVPSRGRARGACTTCHLSERGLLRTQFDSGALLPPRWLRNAEHGPDWIERHKQVAGADSQFCANCHRESECTDCHDGRVRPRRIHPSDWLSLHPIAARQDPSCQSCHRHQSFCLTCHERSGVSMSGPYAAFASRGRFHPPKAVWSDISAAQQPSGHAREAQRNINTCVSCHSERDCAMCHATLAIGGRGNLGLGAGPGINPHPAGFRARCGAALRQNARPCLVCHEPKDPNLGVCR
jgi:hypothetical protein